MKYTTLAIILGLALTVTAQEDTFNYDSTSGKSYGPQDWDKVGCNNLATCPGWPEKLLGSVGWRPSNNQCEWCPIEGNGCGQHRQSPIDLNRDRAIPGNPNEKECPDWHWINYIDGSCAWADMQDSFEIGRNSLMIHTPLTSSGDINCVNEAGERKFPKLDYSKGFPDWWYLSQTDITVPSEHVQHGKRYAAEVKLSHFYEIDHYKNKLGVVSFFMQDFEGEPSWPFLDKLICKWRSEEEEKRLSCGLPPAPVYKMCELYRGQQRSADDFEAPTQAVIVPTRAPLVSPPAIPIQNFGGDPEEFRLPLSLCQGDCDFSTECAPGLICFRRDAFGAVPGCIGGESDETNTDYCVFDPYGPGYATPTVAPTNAPTITARPTITPLNPQPLMDYGGTPPADKFPLQLCEGDCDKDDDCNVGLICFQRTSNETVPGCIGGETDIEKTDYCILDPYGPGFELRFTAEPTVAPVTTSAPTKEPTTSVPTTTPTTAPTEAPVPTVSPTFFPRPVGEPLRLKNLGWEPPVPLDECAGDCDVDDDCGPGLFCFQRNTAYENVPGCTGGDEDPSLTDYCAFRPLPDSSPPSPPTLGPTNAPTTAAPTRPVTPSPTGKPTVTASPTAFVGDLPNITIVGWSPKEPLGECQGDCDNDQDCLPGLKCFQRNRAKVEVPGCLGGSFDQSLTDYCIKDPDYVDEKLGEDVDITTESPVQPTAKPTPKPTTRAPTGPTESPTKAPSKTSVGGSPTPPTDGDNDIVGPDELPPIKDLGWTPPAEMRPLGRCEGDCDIRQDCGEGLDCYQRYLPNLPVPGCSGGELDDSLTDYCVPAEMMGMVGTTTAPQVPQTSVPQPSPTPVPGTQPPVDTPVPGTQPPVDTRVDAPNDSVNSTNTATNATDVTPIPPKLECSAYTAVNFWRMCKRDSCCVNPRSSTEFCHESYDLLGDEVASACHHCCLELQGGAKTVGPAPEENPAVPQILQCDQVDQPDRMCRENSCCDASGSQSQFCREQYALYTPEQVDSICWYCCYPSKTVDWDTRRSLSESPEESLTTSNVKSLRQRKKKPKMDSRKVTTQNFEKNQTLPVSENDRVTHNVNGRVVIVREENFEEKGLMDEEEYFEELMASYKRRALQQSTSENYDDVHYWPYEWFLKVGTEYYFRYEGTQTVPPCYDTAHWRVFKDPIRVAPHQMRELERLIAWRQGDDCEVDTAGKSTGDPNVVDVARPLQSYHRLHRKVFCECQDWPSKFTADRQWCRNWQNTSPEQRLIDSPYNFPSNGFEFL